MQGRYLMEGVSRVDIELSASFCPDFLPTYRPSLFSLLYHRHINLHSCPLFDMPCHSFSCTALFFSRNRLHPQSALVSAFYKAKCPTVTHLRAHLTLSPLIWRCYFWCQEKYLIVKFLTCPPFLPSRVLIYCQAQSWLLINNFGLTDRLNDTLEANVHRNKLASSVSW